MFSEGQAIGKYVIESCLGRGGTGVVYLAQDTLLRRSVALKVLDPSLLPGDLDSQRLVQEAQVVAGLRHPNIIRVHALDCIDDTFVIDMEYVAGGPLMGSGYRGTGGVYEVVPLMGQVLDALASCHKAGIVHRDVKPSNVLVDPQIGALLTDFGLARLLEARQREAMVKTASSTFFVGTPRYAPPESWSGAEPSPAWDVYSVGATLFETVASRPVYSANSPYELMRQMKDNPIPRLDELSDQVSTELADAVAAMLAFEPGTRPRDASEASSMLRETPEMAVQWRPDAVTIQDRKQTGGAISVHTALRSKGRQKRRRLLFAGLATAVLVVVAGLLLGLLAGDAIDHGTAPPPGQPAQVLPAATPEWVHYDLVLVDSLETWEEAWHTWPGEQQEAVLMFHGTRLWFLFSETGEGGALHFTGHWAEYGDETARVFRHGSVSGTGTWTEPGETMAVRLDFHCEQDSSVDTLALTLNRPETDGAPLAALAAAPHFQPLLFNEVAPRGLPWLSELLSLLRLDALEAAAAAPAGLKPDGLADEPVWRESGSVPPLAGPEGAWLKAARYEDRLVLCVNAGRAVKEPVLAVELRGRFRIPIEKSPVWSWQSSRADGTASCTWGAGPDSNTTAEVAFPFGPENLPVPHPGSVWRLQVTLRGTDPAGQPVEMTWGSGVDTLEDGLAVVFP